MRAADPVGEVTVGGRTLPVPRFSIVGPNRSTRGQIEAMAMYAGESVGAVPRVQPAGEIVREIAEEAERLLNTRGSASESRETTT